MIIITIIFAIFYATSMYFMYRAAWHKGFYESSCSAQDIVDEIAKEYNLPRDCFLQAAMKLRDKQEEELEKQNDNHNQ